MTETPEPDPFLNLVQRAMDAEFERCAEFGYTPGSIDLASAVVEALDAGGHGAQAWRQQAALHLELRKIAESTQTPLLDHPAGDRATARLGRDIAGLLAAHPLPAAPDTSS